MKWVQGDAHMRPESVGFIRCLWGGGWMRRVWIVTELTQHSGRTWGGVGGKPNLHYFVHSPKPVRHWPMAEHSTFIHWAHTLTHTHWTFMHACMHVISSAPGAHSPRSPSLKCAQHVAGTHKTCERFRRGPRGGWQKRGTYTHTHTRSHYCRPLHCAVATGGAKSHCASAGKYCRTHMDSSHVYMIIMLQACRHQQRTAISHEHAQTLYVRFNFTRLHKNWVLALQRTRSYTGVKSDFATHAVSNEGAALYEYIYVYII